MFTNRVLHLSTNLVKINQFIYAYSRWLLDLSNVEEKPNYARDSTKTTTTVFLIPENLVVDFILQSYKGGGNPASSQQKLAQVFIRLCRTLLWYVFMIVIFQT